MSEIPPFGGTLDRHDTAFVLIDFQERLYPHIHGYAEIEKKIALLIHCANQLHLPIIVTEQYPQGLGPISPTLNELLPDVEKITKTAFSCFGEDRFVANLMKTQCRTLMIAGIESHVCVAQTALDALRLEYDVHVIEDAVGSRNPRHKEIALERIKWAGGTISCAEMAVFELLKEAGSPEFRAMQKLLKG